MIHQPGDPLRPPLPALPLIDSTRPHPARRYNYWLGGKDHYAADRESGDAIAARFPGIVTAARENHAFAGRAVRYLAQRHDVEQFLDIGTGLPTDRHPHHVAQQIIPAARVVYVDNDPLVLVHARALLGSTPPGRTAYLQADLRQPDIILTSDELTGTLDLSRPVGLLLVAVLHFLVDDEDAFTSVRTLLKKLAPGSFLVLSHVSYDLLQADTRTALTDTAYPGKDGFTSRTHTQIGRFFTGLHLLEPGLTPVSHWHRHPDDPPAPADDQVPVYGGVARKPR
ncbi:SAM-dependent methyltransferase [Actinoplanes sp. GCM10030250]|uniref:SAM-dependent methyltransferase n=1 Tax=Actinoplanes sp. GCM10030250 TaxID=3273376 RepID=UPI0036194B7D